MPAQLVSGETAFSLDGNLAFQHIDRKPILHGLSPLAFLTEALRSDRLELCAKVTSQRELWEC